MARYLSSKLTPSHKDNQESQVAGFPKLVKLDAGARGELARSLPYTDYPSFREFMLSIVLR